MINYLKPNIILNIKPTQKFVNKNHISNNIPKYA